MDHRDLEKINAGLNRNEPADEKSQQQQEMINSVLSQVLTPEARERLMRIEMVRPERAKQAHYTLVQLAQSGQLRSKITEAQLVDLLGRIGAEREQKVSFYRKSNSDDDEPEEPQTQPDDDDDDDDDFFD